MTYEEIFEEIKKSLTEMTGSDKYYTKEEEYLAEAGVSGDKFEVRLRVQAHKKRELLLIYSLLPFVVPANKITEFSAQLAQHNYDNYYLGVYDFNTKTGKIVFRVSIPIKEGTVNPGIISSLLRYTYNTVNKSNSVLYDYLSNGATASLDNDASGDIINRIDQLVGWEPFKELCHEIKDVAPIIDKCEVRDSFLFRNYLIAADSGYGFSTAVDYLSQLLDSCGLFTRKPNLPVVEFALALKAEDGKITPSQLLEMLENKDHIDSLVCLDVCSFIDRATHFQFKEFLQKLIPFENSYVFVFRVPFLEPAALAQIAAVISDVLYLKTLSIVPFNLEQLRQCAVLALLQKNFAVTSDIWEIFDARIREEKSDGRFYGIRSVEKITHEMIWLKCKAQAKSEKEGAQADAAATNSSSEASATQNTAGSSPEIAAAAKCISAKDIEGLSTSFNRETKSGFDELDSLIGMENISTQIREIVTQVKLAMGNDKIDKPSIHMRFVGSPGTGKTTVARIIGKIFRENGILRNGYFFEYAGRDLCGSYVGHTAPKTAGICRDAYGSVLFIDEAYSLYSGDHDSRDYGKEALTTLISEMENHRDDMVIIMAGYTDDMDKLMQGNSGLRSRMPFVIDFKNYTRQQLFDIFMLNVKKHFKYTEDFEAAAYKFFDGLSEEYINSKEFSNARFSRNLYERTWSKAALRCSLDQTDIVLTAEDFVNASSEGDFSEKLPTRHKLGF